MIAAKMPAHIALEVPRNAVKIFYMLGWVSKVLFQRQIKGRRRREMQFLLLALLAGIFICSVMTALFYVIHQQTPR